MELLEKTYAVRRDVKGGTGNDIGYMKNNSDSMRDVLRSWRNSNPEEWNFIIQDLEKNGVEIRDISALKHKYQHFLDAQTERIPSCENKGGR